MQEHCHLLFVFIPCVIHTFFKLHTLSRRSQGAYSYTHCGAHWHLGPLFFTLFITLRVPRPTYSRRFTIYGPNNSKNNSVVDLVVEASAEGMV
ncbi:hypothetical protein EDB85DRAFT_1984885, partial [Lactarius pseudohatsudake]